MAHPRFDTIKNVTNLFSPFSLILVFLFFFLVWADVRGVLVEVKVCSGPARNFPIIEPSSKTLNRTWNRTSNIVDICAVKSCLDPRNEPTPIPPFGRTDQKEIKHKVKIVANDDKLTWNVMDKVLEMALARSQVHPYTISAIVIRYRQNPIDLTLRFRISYR